MIRASMADVAARAGVSVTTVSHVLNDVPGKRIRPDTRERVRRAAADLRYEINGLAKSLRLQRSTVIGLISDEVLITPFAPGMVLGALDTASELGWMVMLTNTGVDRQFEDAQIRAFQQRQVTAFLYMRMYHHDKVVLPSVLAGYPTVLVDGTCDDPRIPSVAPDEFAGGLAAARHFVSNGHTELAIITSNDPIPAARDRLAGFQAGVADAGLELPPDHVVAFGPVPSESDATGGRRAAHRLLSLPRRPTAIFCFTDRVAAGVYQAAREADISIPAELSVIGFDNQDNVTDSLFPGLTSLALPHYGMGAWGVRTLIDHVDDPTAVAEQLRLPCPLIHRGSVTQAPRPVTTRKPPATRAGCAS